VPIVFRGPGGSALQLGAQHSQAFESFYAHVPGLKVVMPATPADAKGLLKSAIRDEDPVVFIEGEMLYNIKGDVPEGEYVTPIGVADVKRPGRDATIICHSKTVGPALKAAEELAGAGIEAEVIDLRTIRPLDERAILESVARTNRCVVAEEGWPFAGVGAQVVDLIQREVFDALDAPHHLAHEEHPGILVPDGALEQAPGVGRRGRHHHLEAGHVRVEALERLGMLGPELQRRAARSSEDDRHADLPARHVAHLGGRVDDLVDGQQREVPGHHLDDRTEADHRGADADAGEPQLGDGRVDHPLGTELLEESTAHLVGAVVLRDLLAHQEDPVVALHLLAEGVIQGVAVGERRHDQASPGSGA
jgi:hypothetical protein